MRVKPEVIIKVIIIIVKLREKG